MMIGKLKLPIMLFIMIDGDYTHLFVSGRDEQE